MTTISHRRLGPVNRSPSNFGCCLLRRSYP